MSYLNKMYGRKPLVPAAADKNPNRVMGGLRAQGVDSFKMLGEDGVEREIASHRYVRSLEEKLRSQSSVIEHLQKQVNRLNRSVESFESVIRSKK
jgi:CII-binding regulator of phage lambda lysogenization HflD